MSKEGKIRASVHFATGLAMVLAAAVLSSFVHNSRFGRQMEMSNLDSWFRAGKSDVDQRIVVVEITDADYAGPVFRRVCPLPVEGVGKLLRAVALSGPKAIAVDLDTAHWTAAERTAIRTLAGPAQIAWAIGGWEDAQGNVNLESMAGEGSCFGVPASLPDEYGVVRGFLPYVPQKGVAVPSLAIVASRIYAGEGCTSEVRAPVSAALPPAELIDYSGGPDRFVHLTAATLLGAADTEAWRKSNPLQGKIAVVGGYYQEARDRFVTPAGYINGVDILAHAMVSAMQGGIPEPSHESFFVSDLILGTLLITGGYFLHRFWMLAISFVAIPGIAFVASFVLYRYTGYFMSFMPILAAVFLHHLVEHEVEHWRLKREVQKLRGGGGAGCQACATLES